MTGRDDNGKPIIEYKTDFYDRPNKKIMLGHSCDEWIIGTPEEARAFIGQLTEIVERAEKQPDTEILEGE